MPVLPPLPPEERPLAERFAVPPPSARILRIIHSQKDNPEEQDQQLRTLAAQGFGGFAGNVAFDGYVDDETKWPAFLRGVRLAKAAGMSLWLYDECGYPSGSAATSRCAATPNGPRAACSSPRRTPGRPGFARAAARPTGTGRGSAASRRRDRAG